MVNYKIELVDRLIKATHCREEDAFNIIQWLMERELIDGNRLRDAVIMEQYQQCANEGETKTVKTIKYKLMDYFNLPMSTIHNIVYKSEKIF